MTLTRPKSSRREFCSGRRGEENFGEAGNGVFDGVGDAVGRLVNIPQPVRLVNDNQIPVHLTDVNVVGAGEVVGANDDRSGWLNGLRFPFRICSLKVLVSRMTEGRKNLSVNS